MAYEAAKERLERNLVETGGKLQCIDSYILEIQRIQRIFADLLDIALVNLR